MNNDQISMLLAYMIQSQSSGGFVQNFLFPFLLSAMSAIIGAYAAYFLLGRRELQAKHESNLNSLNMLWLNAIDAFSHLEARKRSYIDNSGLMSDPIDRALCLLTYHENIKAFAVPVETTFLLAKAKRRTKHLIWSNAEASLLINENHRSLIMTWQMRNKINEQIKELILDNQSFAQLTDRDLKERIGGKI